MRDTVVGCTIIVVAPTIEFSPILVIPQAFNTKLWVLTGPQIADLLNVTPPTFRGWVSRKLFPPSDGMVNGKTPYWYLTTVIEYVRNAPGGRLGYPVE